MWTKKQRFFVLIYISLAALRKSSINFIFRHITNVKRDVDEAQLNRKTYTESGSQVPICLETICLLCIETAFKNVLFCVQPVWRPANTKKLCRAKSQNKHKPNDVRSDFFSFSLLVAGSCIFMRGKELSRCEVRCLCIAQFTNALFYLPLVSTRIFIANHKSLSVCVWVCVCVQMQEKRVRGGGKPTNRFLLVSSDKMYNWRTQHIFTRKSRLT